MKSFFLIKSFTTFTILTIFSNINESIATSSNLQSDCESGKNWCIKSINKGYDAPHLNVGNSNCIDLSDGKLCSLTDSQTVSADCAQGTVSISIRTDQNSAHISGAVAAVQHTWGKDGNNDLNHTGKTTIFVYCQ